MVGWYQDRFCAALGFLLACAGGTLTGLGIGLMQHPWKE